MTAEIAVMNKEAIALAADSAVTLRTKRGQKIFTSAQKIFCLSDKHPVGIMVYGNASLLQVPWEIIVKLYGERIGTKTFNSLQGYCDDFFGFIEKDKLLFPRKEQEKYIRGNIRGYFQYLREKILEEVNEKLEKQEKIDRKEISKIVSQKIEKEYRGWRKSKLLPRATAKRISDFKKKYNAHIQKIRKETFEKLPITRDFSRKLDEIAIWLFFKFNESGVANKNVSGIVIAGFGKKDIFPRLNSYTIEGIANDFLKFRKDTNNKIDFEMNAAILPFAQKEMVIRFIEGIDPSFLRLIGAGLYELAEKYPKLVVDKLKMDKKSKARVTQDISKQIKTTTGEFLQKLKKIRREYFVDPILQVVGMLPKDELALMVETLVTLTSFKRRISMEDETVGGPIDVVVISKRDGFVWIKKKEYFNRNIQN